MNAKLLMTCPWTRAGFSACNEKTPWSRGLGPLLRPKKFPRGVPIPFRHSPSVR